MILGADHRLYRPAFAFLAAMFMRSVTTSAPPSFPALKVKQIKVLAYMHAVRFCAIAGIVVSPRSCWPAIRLTVPLLK